MKPTESNANHAADGANSVSRRVLLQAGAAAGLAAAAAPAVLGADDKSATRPAVLGAANHRYEVVEGWGKAPDGITYGNTHAVCQSADGRIFIHHTGGPDTVVVFDPDGKFVKSW